MMFKVLMSMRNKNKFTHAFTNVTPYKQGSFLPAFLPSFPAVLQFQKSGYCYRNIKSTFWIETRHTFRRNSACVDANITSINRRIKFGVLWGHMPLRIFATVCNSISTYLPKATSCAASPSYSHYFYLGLTKIKRSKANNCWQLIW